MDSLELVLDCEIGLKGTRPEPLIAGDHNPPSITHHWDPLGIEHSGRQYAFDGRFGETCRIATDRRNPVPKAKQILIYDVTDVGEVNHRASACLSRRDLVLVRILDRRPNLREAEVVIRGEVLDTLATGNHACDRRDGDTTTGERRLTAVAARTDHNVGELRINRKFAHDLLATFILCEWRVINQIATAFAEQHLPRSSDHLLIAPSGALAVLGCVHVNCHVATFRGEVWPQVRKGITQAVGLSQAGHGLP